ncbi:inositol monophosphatase family protein [Corynebacterium lizhenjunii]|uniref:inositol monophosphatase family protein n=1 Tax=Corynebacterium lizhenjunii TaxID=2709394 RepID=UPI0013E9AE49|nr:inositol monophosphatase [Corynebacterium lizhenjunii]
MHTPGALLAVAEAAVDEVEPLFIQGLGAPPAQQKSGGGFVTQVDWAIEQRLRTALTQFTGIAVYGEEFGGNLCQDTVWVVDPIDGTANYSAGNPLCGILVSLLHRGQPVVAVASFPLLGRRVAAAEGGVLRSHGAVAPASATTQGGVAAASAIRHVGCSTHLSPQNYANLLSTGLRPRMTGSVGVDTAFVAQGVFAGAVNYSAHPWDNAAGALLVRAAGGTATDPEGRQWTAASAGLVVGTPEVHATLLAALQEQSEEED